MFPGTKIHAEKVKASVCCQGCCGDSWMGLWSGQPLRSQGLLALLPDSESVWVCGEGAWGQGTGGKRSHGARGPPCQTPRRVLTQPYQP